MKYLKTYESQSNDKELIMSLIEQFMNKYKPDYSFYLPGKHIIKEWFLNDKYILNYIIFHDTHNIEINISEEIKNNQNNILLDYESNPHKASFLYNYDGFYSNFDYNTIKDMLDDYEIYKEGKELGII